MFSLSRLLCLFVVAGTAIMTAEGGIVTGGWFPITGLGYKYQVMWSATNWHSARHYCQRLGGDLAVQGMKHYGTRYAISNIMLNGQAFWIGIHDLYREGRWQWVDGSYGTSRDIHWNRGEPNSYRGSEEDCAEIIARIEFRTNDVSCGLKLAALCEKKI